MRRETHCAEYIGMAAARGRIARSLVALFGLCALLIIWSTIASGVVSAELGAEAAPPSQSQTGPKRATEWRESLACGPNSLLIFLRCHGYEASFDKVRELAPISERGASFADLWKGANTLGASVSLIRTDLDGLRHRTMPMIVLLDGLDSPFDHFTVVTSTESDSVTLLDPVSTVSTTIDLGTFQRLWTGHALVHTRNRFGWEVCLSIIVIVAAGVVYMSSTYFPTLQGTGDHDG